jgi:hypothetical protein
MLIVVGFLFSQEPDFFGTLVVTCDSGDTLPVYLDGKKVGSTPLTLERVDVGHYAVSFLSPGTRDSLIQKFRSTLPEELGNKFGSVDPSTVAQFSTQQVIIRNRQRSEAVFSLGEITATVHTINKSQYLKIAFASGLMVLAFIVIFTQAF